MDTPQEAPAPVVVVPIPAKQSRTLKLGNVLAYLGGAVALLPELASDPIVVTFLNEAMSPLVRRSFGLAMFALGFFVRHLRKTTAAPIAGTDAATTAMQFSSSAHIAPDRK